MRPLDGLDGETRDPPREEVGLAAAPQLALTIAHHPEPERIGERALFPDGHFQLSRLAPDFAPIRGFAARPVADPYVSRSPLTGALEGGALVLEGSAVVDGEPLEGRRRLERAALERGVVIELARRVVVVAHLSTRELPEEPHGLVGESDALQILRREIARVAARDVAVLVRGETGTGKELVARAIHEASARARGPFVAVSLAAVAPSVAASELFGHRRGAFTGADEDRAGCFRRAHGGTLFLDEIGECPVDVQVALLRAIDSRRVQPVGADRDEAVDVRLVTATDAPLERAVSEGRFRAPLLHRLAGYELFLPRLTARREDVGRLLAAFLAAQDAPALPASVVARLVAYGWPGNVRQLKNVAAQLALAASAGAGELERVLARLPAASTEAPAAPSNASPAPAAVEPPREAPRDARRKPASVSSAELIAALERNQWKIDRAAAELGISRPSAYRLIDADPTLRKAKDLDRQELARALDAHDGDLDRMSEQLKVSKAGLRLRLKEEGLTGGRSRSR